jgi:purine-cytosine permease-like protein
MALDPEKNINEKVTKKPAGDESSSPPRSSTEYYNSTAVTQDNGVFSRLRRLEASMDAKLGIESEAIDRKLPEDRKPVRLHERLTMALLWASGTMNISCFATGFLGYEFGLDLKQSILIIIFASLLGAAVTGYCATFGAPTGLRQMSVSRFSFGWYPNKIVAVLNTINQLGWGGVSTITAGLALQAVADGNLSLAVGVVIVSVVSLVVSFFGLRAILVYERYGKF